MLMVEMDQQQLQMVPAEYLGVSSIRRQRNLLQLCRDCSGLARQTRPTFSMHATQLPETKRNSRAGSQEAAAAAAAAAVDRRMTSGELAEQKRLPASRERPLRSRSGWRPTQARRSRSRSRTGSRATPRGLRRRPARAGRSAAAAQARPARTKAGGSSR